MPLKSNRFIWIAARFEMAYLNHGQNISRFALVGLLNTCLDFALFNVFYYGLSINLLIANTLSYGTGIINSFFLNKYWTFSGSEDRRKYSHSVQFLLFLGLNLIALLISNGVVWWSALYIPAIWAKVLAIIVVFAWNYLMSRNVVFKMH